MTHEITPFYHIISQRITRHFGNQSVCRESVECSQAIGKCQWEGNAHDFGYDEDEDEAGDDMKLTSIQSITDYLMCAGSTLPDNIRLWARRNLRLRNLQR